MPTAPSKLRKEAKDRTNGNGKPMNAGDWRRHAEEWQRWYETAAKERDAQTRVVKTLSRQLQRIARLATAPLADDAEGVPNVDASE